MSHKGSVEPSYRQRPAYHTMLLGMIALLASSLLVVGEVETRDAIAARKAEDLTANLSQVIDPATHDNDLLADAIVIDNNGEKTTVYRARKEGTVIAVAFETSAVGYAGPVVCLMGLKADGTVLGVRVLSHAETPGLGDKIEVARTHWILDFDGRSLGNPPEEKWKVKKDGGIFDQFSGATITPRAVVLAVTKGLKLFQANQQTLLHSEPTAQAEGDSPSQSKPEPRHE